METVSSSFAEKDRLDIVEGHKDSDSILISGRTLIVRPLNAKGVIAAFSLIKEAADKIGAAASASLGEDVAKGQRVTKFISSLTSALADEIEKPIKLMHLVLQRANPSLDIEWLKEEMNFVEHFGQFWEIFNRQNKVDVLLKKAAERITPALSAAKNLTASIPRSSNSPDSADGTTDGPSTSSSADAPTAGETTN